VRRERSILTASFITGTATVTAVDNVACFETFHDNPTCHEVKAQYQVLTTRHEFDSLHLHYETDNAIRNGTFQYILNRESPGTPLIVGEIFNPSQTDTILFQTEGEGGSGDNNMFPAWAIALLAVSGLIFCCCCMSALHYYSKQRGGQNNVGAYEENGDSEECVIQVIPISESARTRKKSNSFGGNSERAAGAGSKEAGGRDTTALVERDELEDEADEVINLTSPGAAFGSMARVLDDGTDEEICPRFGENNEFARETHCWLLERTSDN
jgi:hypothetical protein